MSLGTSAAMLATLVTPLVLELGDGPPPHAHNMTTAASAITGFFIRASSAG
jgi:hypothetical protein